MELQEGISTNVLANRLRWLTDEGLLTKHAHPRNRRKYYYEITEKGFDLILVIIGLAEWSWRYLPGAWSPLEVKKLFKRNRAAFAKVWRKKVKERSREYLNQANSSTTT